MSAGALVAVGSPTSTPFILRIGPRMFQGATCHSRDQKSARRQPAQR